MASHPCLFSADVGLIHLDRTPQAIASGADHCASELVEDRPDGLVAIEAELSLNAEGACAVLRVGDEPHHPEPNRQRDASPVEDRPSGRRRLVAASGALHQPARLPGPRTRRTAARTALCLRWGTYLAVLLDEHKPLEPRIGSEEISMISDPEMKRINLEFSANLARLICMLHEDEGGCYRLLRLAHQHLAMPGLRLRECAELFDSFHALTSSDFWNLAGPDLKARMERTRPIVLQHRIKL